VLDDESNKVLVVQCHNAVFAIAYTGVAVAHETWMDCVIADCLAHRKLGFALAQPGTPLLARPAFSIINELKINLNGVLNSDSLSRAEGLELLIQGWEFGKKRLIPFACKLRRGPRHANEYRYLDIQHQPVTKFFREHPTGLWGETLGDDGGAINEALEKLKSTVRFAYDDVEEHIRQSVIRRSRETETVSAASVALQLDPRVPDGQVTFTYYPNEKILGGYPLLSPWVMTPRMICSPAVTSSGFSRQSDCGNYVLGGFSDANTNLHVITRLPANKAMPRGKGTIRIGFQQRPNAPGAKG
jgi:hypothetical protein